jgi:hypothetical protein
VSITFACDCGRTVNAPDTAAGKRARCPGCGDLIKVPDADDPKAVAAAMATASQAAPSAPPMPPRQPQTVSAPTTASMAPAAAPVASSVPHWAAPAMPPEPWYYGLLAFIAGVWTVLGVGQFLLVLFVFVGGGTVGVGPERGEVAMAVIPLVMMSGGAMIGMLLSAGLVLLAVDAARNVRAIRWKT